jgi:beta-phosphoglucomutase
LEHASVIVAEKERHYLSHNAFRFYDGALALLGDLRRAGVALALVSGAGRVRLTKTCGADFLELFGVVITGDDVTHGKPHPEPYLRAAEALVVPADRCLVVENAPLGIRAAKAAGMDCVAIMSTLGRPFLLDADLVVSSLDEIRPVVSSPALISGR